MQGCEASAGSKLVLTSSLVAFPYAYSWKDADVLSWCRVDVDGRESVRELDVSMSTFVPKEANLSMFSSVAQSCPNFVTPWTAACQASLSITNSQSPPKLMSIELVMPSNHLILCSSPSSPALNLSEDQGLFKWVSSSHQVAKVLEFQLQRQSFQWTPKTHLL